MSNPRFKTNNKEDSSYNPYGKKFTERQLQIIEGVPVEGLRSTEVTIVMRKAEKLGRDDIADAVYIRYEEMISGPKIKCPCSLEELKERFQKITPYKIEW